MPHCSKVFDAFSPRQFCPLVITRHIFVDTQKIMNTSGGVDYYNGLFRSINPGAFRHGEPL